MSDQEENFRNAISKLKAQLANKESILSRPPITKDSRGRPCQESQGSRIRLHEDCQDLQQRITELETGMLLIQYRRSIDPLTRNVVAQAAIEKQLAERGFYVQGVGESIAAEVRAEQPSIGNKASQKLHAKQTEHLVFIKGKDGYFHVKRPFTSAALMNTYNQILPILGQVRAFVLAKGNQATVQALRRSFGSTALGKVATSENWESWIEDFSNRTTEKNATLLFLERGTGIKRETLGPRLSRVRTA